jgi:hypothetical protein
MLSASRDVTEPEPRWPAALGVLAAAVLHYALPDGLRLGPPWLIAGVVVTLLIVAWGSHRLGHHDVNAKAGYVILVVLTLGLLYGVARLMAGLVNRTIAAPVLLRTAAVLWCTNVLVFAIWYWRLDAGGPNARDRHHAHTRGAFLFPQMAVNAPRRNGADPDVTLAEAEGWRPGFVDYLFVAFNTSTAFSPTDVPVLSRWGKLAMMMQSTISVTAVVLLVGRAVNLL